MESSTNRPEHRTRNKFAYIQNPFGDWYSRTFPPVAECGGGMVVVLWAAETVNTESYRKAGMWHGEVFM